MRADMFERALYLVIYRATPRGTTVRAGIYTVYP
jgi:hypothetical protein